MEPVVRALTEQHAQLDALLSGLDDAGWARPSRCPGWSVADVVLHLAQTEELALASGHGRLTELAGPEWLARDGGFADVDAAAGLAVERERGETGPAVHRRWRDCASELRAMFAAADPRTPMRWVSGELPARTLATTRLAESWIHTGDVSDALGVAPVSADRLWHIARLAWRTLPYAFARSGRELSGPVGLELAGPGSASWTFGVGGGTAAGEAGAGVGAAAGEAVAGVGGEAGVGRVAVAAPATVVRGPALDFCLVAARRLDPAASALTTEGPDADAVLSLVRTFA
jgi:uncharacterized protein (TIGR03084 family)